MTRIVLVNPNTDRNVTEAMLAIARDAAAAAAAGEADDVELVGLTAATGARLITDDAALQMAADAVIALAPDIARCEPHAVIVAAFGDPALVALRERLAVPIIGICEAAMAQAASGGRRFGVVTTTPRLGPSIARAAVAYGHASDFAGTWFTRQAASADNPPDTAGLVEDLAEACGRALAEAPLASLIIGGGPLAAAARLLAGRIPTPLIQPVPAAVRLALRRLCDRSRSGAGGFSDGTFV
jgi:Asp/Glu/hydantoin racemase